MLLALHDSHARAGLMRGKRGRHAGRSAADNDHVERLRRHRRYSSGLRAIVAHTKRRHPSAPPSAVPRPAKIRHPPAAPCWGHTPARGPESPPRGSGKSHSGTDHPARQRRLTPSTETAPGRRRIAATISASGTVSQRQTICPHAGSDSISFSLRASGARSKSSGARRIGSQSSRSRRATPASRSTCSMRSAMAGALATPGD